MRRRGTEIKGREDVGGNKDEMKEEENKLLEREGSYYSNQTVRGPKRRWRVNGKGNGSERG